MSFDLTLDNYRSLCQAIARRRTDCRFITYLKSEQKDGFIILRHDVDRKPERALRMALLEHELGIRSSYYFRSTKGSFDPEIMKRIEGMGHEIGYHYEALVKAKGNLELAKSIFSKDLERFRKYVDINTICSHGNPLSKFDNRIIWKKELYSNYSIIGDSSVELPGIYYLSDTGGRWNSDANIRDRPTNSLKLMNIRSTSDLMNAVNGDVSLTICINCHPERWGVNSTELIIQSMKDVAVNSIKYALKVVRK